MQNYAFIFILANIYTKRCVKTSALTHLPFIPRLFQRFFSPAGVFPIAVLW